MFIDPPKMMHKVSIGKRLSICLSQTMLTA